MDLLTYRATLLGIASSELMQMVSSIRRTSLMLSAPVFRAPTSFTRQNLGGVFFRMVPRLVWLKNISVTVRGVWQSGNPTSIVKSARMQAAKHSKMHVNTILPITHERSTTLLSPLLIGKGLRMRLMHDIIEDFHHLFGTTATAATAGGNEAAQQIFRCMINHRRLTAKRNRHIACEVFATNPK